MIQRSVTRSTKLSLMAKNTSRIFFYSFLFWLSCHGKLEGIQLILVYVSLVSSYWIHPLLHHHSSSTHYNSFWLIWICTIFLIYRGHNSICNNIQVKAFVGKMKHIARHQQNLIFMRYGLIRCGFHLCLESIWFSCEFRKVTELCCVEKL
jgi:hypothetical protein